MSEARGAATVLQRVLGRRLQTLRVEAGLTAQEAGARIRRSTTAVTRMERAETALEWLKVKELLALYGVSDAESQEFLALAEQANEPGWWQSFRDVLPAWFGVHVSLESAATHLRAYEAHHVPGLLQTPEYAEELLRLGFPHESREELKRRVALRMERQQLLAKDSPIKLWAVMDETVFRRETKPAPTLCGQVEHLLEMTDHPHVTLQVHPFSHGPYKGAFGPFSIFRFEVFDFPDVVCTESLDGTAYKEDPQVVELYRETFESIITTAFSKRETKAFLNTIRKELHG